MNKPFTLKKYPFKAGDYVRAMSVSPVFTEMPHEEVWIVRSVVKSETYTGYNVIYGNKSFWGLYVREGISIVT